MLSLVIVYGCVSSQSEFDKGAEKLSKLDEQYGASLKVPPETTDEIDDLIAQIIGFSALNENTPKSLEDFIDFKIKFLEAEKLLAEGWQWGRGSTTTFGFGCKRGYARISESARLRNLSAITGFEAVELLQTFVDNFPEESKSLNLTTKDALFLNAMYFEVKRKALGDASLIQSACGNKQWNKTLPV